MVTGHVSTIVAPPDSNLGYMEPIGDRIKRLREGLSLSQLQLATQVKVSRVAVTKWESGATENMKLANIMALCRIFGISAEELITGHNTGNPKRQSVTEISQPKPAPMRAKVKKLADLADKLSDDGVQALIGQAILLEANYPRRASKTAS